MMSIAEPAVRVTLRQQMAYLVDHFVRAGEEAVEEYTAGRRSETILNLLDRCRALGDADSYLRLMDRFGSTLYRSSHLGILDGHLEAALASPALSNRQRVELADMRARLLMERGKLELAGQVLDDAASAADKPLLRAQFHNRRAVLLYYRRQYDVAHLEYEKALVLAQEGDAPKLVSTIYNNLGNWAFAQDKYETALTFYRRAIEVAGPIGQAILLARAEGGMAMTLPQLGRYEEATSYYERARQHYKQAGDRLGLVRTNLNLSYLAILQGDSETAKARASDALHIARRLGDLSREAFALHNLGHACLIAREYEAACEHLTRALRMREQIGKTLYVETTKEVIQQLVEAMATDPDIGRDARRRIRSRCTDALAGETV